jgi:hypothetical protein
MLLAPAAARCEAPPAPLQGVARRGLALAAAVHPAADNKKLCVLSLCYAPLAGGEGRTIDECSWGLGPALPWVAGQEHVWVGMDPRSLEALSRREFLHRYRLDDLLKGRRVTYPDEKDRIPREYFFPDGDILGDVRSLMFMADFEPQLFVSYLPTGPEQLRVFVLTNVRGRIKRTDKDGELTGRILDVTPEESKNPRWSLTAYDFQNEWNAKEGRLGEGKWSKGEPIGVAFEQPFQAAAAGEDYYFVTASGKVYRSPRPDKGKERKTEAIWDDGKRPVVAFIRDVDAGKSFVFCKPDKEGKGVYIELVAKPNPCPYDGKDIKPAKADDPLPAVLGYAKILVADKKIKEK